MTNRHDFRIDEKIGLDRVESAAYVGVSPSLFDEMVADGRYPQPKEQNGRVTWDREELRLAFKRLPARVPEVKGETAPPKLVDASSNPWNRGRNSAA